MTPVYICAEIGINHNGDSDILHRLIDAAVRADVDAVKFQVGDPCQYVNPAEHDTERDTPWGRLRYVEYRQKLELSDDQLVSAAEHARSNGLDFIVSPLDVLTVPRLEQLGLDCDAYKVASPKIVDRGLLHILRTIGRPLILSTGMCTLDELDDAVDFLTARNTPALAVLHCVSKYPCPPDELNLQMIPALQARYPHCTIGYSGHEVGLATTEAAVALGARIVERHLTLDRSMWGSDQAASVEPEAFASMVAHIRSIEQAKGTGQKQVDPTLPNWGKFRYSNTLYSSNA